MADSWQIASKSLRPLPVAHKEMNEESRVRQRYVDMVVNPDSRQMVRTKAAVLKSLRSTLTSAPALRQRAKGPAHTSQISWSYSIPHPPFPRSVWGRGIALRRSATIFPTPV